MQGGSKVNRVITVRHFSECRKPASGHLLLHVLETPRVPNRISQAAERSGIRVVKHPKAVISYGKAGGIDAGIHPISSAGFPILRNQLLRLCRPANPQRGNKRNHRHATLAIRVMCFFISIFPLNYRSTAPSQRSLLNESVSRHQGYPVPISQEDNQRHVH